MNKKMEELLLKILLLIESIEPSAESKDIRIEGYAIDEIEKILEIAYDEGFFKGIEAHSKDGKNWLQISLTMTGMNIVEDYRNNLKIEILKAALDDDIGIAPIVADGRIGHLLTISKQEEFAGKEYIEAFRDLIDMGCLAHEGDQPYRITFAGKNFLKDSIPLKDVQPKTENSSIINMSIFMSYISEEVNISKVLKKSIETAFGGKYKVFVSSEATDLPPGAPWLKKIESAIADAKIIIVLCSPESIKHPWISFEAGAGWIKGKEVIPICHSGLKINELPLPLSIFQALDINQDDFVEKLFIALSEHLDIREQPQISFSYMKDELSKALVSIKPKPLGTIEFKSNSPEEEGWQINVKDKNSQPPEFNIIHDGYWGEVLKINLPDGDCMDYPVRYAGNSAKSIEFIIKTEGSWTLYSHIIVTSRNVFSPRDVWLAFKDGQDEPKPFGDGKYEWSVYCLPEPIGGNWIKISANLIDAVSKTFGQKGEKYHRLIGFRIRGKLTIAKIEWFC